jgi:hypothetical protein
MVPRKKMSFAIFAPDGQLGLFDQLPQKGRQPKVIETDPIPPESSGGWKMKLVKDFILANPGATIPEVVKSTRTAARTVSRARRDLLRAGLITEAPTGRPAKTAPLEMNPTDVDAQIRRDIEDAISKGKPPLTREERRQRLSAYADHPKVPTQAKIAALKELEATEPAESATLGPGAPLTREERVHRVSLMIEALIDVDGPAAVGEALQKANYAPTN